MGGRRRCRQFTHECITTPRQRTFWVRIMPTEIHDCHQQWIKNAMIDLLTAGSLTAAEFLSAGWTEDYCGRWWLK
ncbi:hypothetical protein VTN96DRAFT_8109 [Rasamsonia emersonii]